MPSWMSLNFQDSGSPSMGELSVFHDHVVVVMSGVIVLIIYIMTYLLMGNKYYKVLSEGTFIEMIWSIVPAFLLIILVMPSMKVLYFMEDVKAPSLTFKIIAHQWYWSYVVPLYKNFSYLMGKSFFGGYEYDSLLESDDSSSPRLLTCSSDLVVPLNMTSRLLISSTDVIHSFAVPSMGLKVDAMPGRINQLFVNPSRMGVFYGQCSEICGSNHSFMPIVLKVFDILHYDLYTKGLLLELVEENFGSVKLNI